MVVIVSVSDAGADHVIQFNLKTVALAAGVVDHVKIAK